MLFIVYILYLQDLSATYVSTDNEAFSVLLLESWKRLWAMLRKSHVSEKRILPAEKFSG